MKIENARTLRKRLTPQEVKIWMKLRELKKLGFHFRRQAPIGRYIVDFASFGARIVIEVDGGQHYASALDEVRTRHLEAKGYRLLRFWNSDVLQNISGVLLAIDAVVNTDTPPTPDPSPPQAGGGEK